MTSDNDMTSVIDDFAALLVDPKYSDLEIWCDGRVFKVHRAIVCSFSKILSKECDGNFNESSTRIIKHTTFSASTVEMMLQFMYRRSYTLANIDVGVDVVGSSPTLHDDDAVIPSSASSSSSDGIDPPPESSPDPSLHLAIAHIDVYAIADYYDISALKTLAFQNFSHHKPTVSHKNFHHLLRAVYTRTAKRNDPLRQSIVEETITRGSALFHNETFTADIFEDPSLQHFSADLLPPLYTAADSATARLQARIESLGAWYAVAQHEADRAGERIAVLERSNGAKNEALERTVRLTRETTSCRNCGVGFGGHLDGVDVAVGLDRSCILRCRVCKCKHLDKS